MALGRVVPARRAIAASSAREAEGEKARNGPRIVVSVRSLEKLITDVFLVVDHDSDLKNRCSAGRFRVIAIHILSLNGGSKPHFAKKEASTLFRPVDRVGTKSSALDIPYTGFQFISLYYREPVRRIDDSYIPGRKDTPYRRRERNRLTTETQSTYRITRSPALSSLA